MSEFEIVCAVTIITESNPICKMPGLLVPYDFCGVEDVNFVSSAKYVTQPLVIVSRDYQ